jgi:tyrosinase
MAEPTPPTRFQQVRDIFDRAAGASTADYGGIGRFWELPLARLLEVEVHGVRMIAPAAGASVDACCGHRAVRSSAQSPRGEPPEERRQAGRGAASGLIRGLRGEPPFDGSRFPRLPWGGSAVAEDGIRFISDWIDDGCPEDDHEIAAYDLGALAAAPRLAAVRADNVEAVAQRHREAFELYAGSANEYKFRQGETKQRMNLDCMPEDQVGRLRRAMRELFELNHWAEDRRSYNNLALIHQNHCQHGWERFLPWHRIYLYEFEQALQDHCPDVTLPYWDWTMPQYRPEHPQDGWRIPKALQAYLTPESIDFLRKAKPRLPKAAADTLLARMVKKDLRYSSQRRFFRAVKEMIGERYTVGEHRLRFIDALLAANSLWYPLRYPAEYDNDEPINRAVHYHYPTAADIEQIVGLRSFRDFGGGSLYNDAFGFLDQNPHNTMHLWTGGKNPDYRPAAADPDRLELAGDVGRERNRGVQVAGRRFHTREDFYGQPQFGDMFSNLTASYDPIFWPVHSNVDRLWWEWQQLHANSLPADLDAVLTPWSYTVADTIDMSRFGYEYVKSAYLVPVGLDAPVGRFVSRPFDIPETVRRAFRQAEVRLHRVPQLPRSGFIRVFLNLPGAGVATSIKDPHYAGYLAIFGHGPCYGGPGHCEVPPLRARQYDLRPRSHDTPRNHRVDVTACARRLLAQGAASLQITLVVVGADYRADDELLRLEGVSLNFLD